MAFEKRRPGARMGGRNNKRTGSTSSRPGKKRPKKEVKKGRWSPEEDKLLAELVEEQRQRRKGLSLADISWDEVEEGFGSRTKKQCRERWISQLDPTLNRGQWTPEEDALLEELAEKTNRKWANIARKMPGRTENMVKNRFHALQRQNGGGKQAKRRRKASGVSRKQKPKLSAQRHQASSVASFDNLSEGSKSSDEVHPLSCVTNVGQSKSRSNNLVKSDSMSSLEKLGNNLFGDVFSPTNNMAPLSKVPSFDTFIARDVSEPFADKPDVILRHPSFEAKDVSSANLMERQFSTDSANWGKISLSKGPSFDFLSSMSRLEKPLLSYDVKKLDQRQRSFGQVSTSDIDQVFFQEQQLDPMLGYNKQ